MWDDLKASESEESEFQSEGQTEVHTLAHGQVVIAIKVGYRSVLFLFKPRHAKDIPRDSPLGFWFGTEKFEDDSCDRMNQVFSNLGVSF